MLDALTLDGANALAKTIRAYWAAQGKTVSTYLEITKLPGSGGNKSGDFYCVRSDMVGGLPQR